MTADLPRTTVILVDDEANILNTARICLEDAGFAVDAFANPLKALDAIKQRSYQLAFFDLKMQPIDGMELLRQTRQITPDTTVVLMTAHGSVDSAVEAIKLGAFDYLQKPFEFSELQTFARKMNDHHKLQSEVRMLREELRRHAGNGEIVTRNERVQSVIALARQVASSGISVLIEGESGTGKELLARLIHHESDRSGQPFVTVNCGALPHALLESELFGHVRGAFTGAVKDRQGRFEAADGGTVFLDEVGELEPSTQVKLLRFLQSKEFERVGESVTRKVDVRIIAATNKNLEEAVGSGTFREDLFYRLNAVRLKLPPLRERTDDVPLLVQHFLDKVGARGEIADEAMEALRLYHWKGNVRELENVMERAAILSRNEKVQLHHLPEEFQAVVPTGSQPYSLEEMERQQIMKVLRIAKDLDDAAGKLGIDPATLWRKRKKYNL
jgi:NtrC-family two-component system response regulator AlgB